MQWRYGVSAFCSFLPVFEDGPVVFPTTAAPELGSLGPVPFVFHCTKRSDAQEWRTKITV